MAAFIASKLWCARAAAFVILPSAKLVHLRAKEIPMEFDPKICNSVVPHHHFYFFFKTKSPQDKNAWIYMHIHTHPTGKKIINSERFSPSCKNNGRVLNYGYKNSKLFFVFKACHGEERSEEMVCIYNSMINGYICVLLLLLSAADAASVWHIQYTIVYGDALEHIHYLSSVPYCPKTQDC